MCLASSGETRVFHICMKSSFTKIQLYNCNVFNIEFEQLIKVSQGNQYINQLKRCNGVDFLLPFKYGFNCLINKCVCLCCQYSHVYIPHLDICYDKTLTDDLVLQKQEKLVECSLICFGFQFLLHLCLLQKFLINDIIDTFEQIIDVFRKNTL